MGYFAKKDNEMGCPKCSSSTKGAAQVDFETRRVLAGFCPNCGAFANSEFYLADRVSSLERQEHLSMVNICAGAGFLRCGSADNFLEEAWKLFDHQKKLDEKEYREARREHFVLLLLKANGVTISGQGGKVCPKCRGSELMWQEAIRSRSAQADVGVCVDCGAFLGDEIYLTEEEEGPFTQVRCSIWNLETFRAQSAQIATDIQSRSGGFVATEGVGGMVNVEYYLARAMERDADRYKRGHFETFWRRGLELLGAQKREVSPAQAAEIRRKRFEEALQKLQNAAGGPVEEK